MSSLTFIQLETFSFISEIRDVDISAVIVFQKFSSSFTPMQIIGNGFPDNLEGLAREKLNKVQNMSYKVIDS